MKIRILFISLLLPVLAMAQNQTAIDYAQKLDSANMRAIVTRLAAEDMAGRKSSEPGSRMAANYLIKLLNNHAIKKGCNNSYEQNIQAFNKTSANKYFNLPNFNYSRCYSYDNNTQQDSVISADSIIFAGYGIHHATYNDFAGIDVSGKIVMVLEGEGPRSKYGVSCHASRSVPDMEFLKKQKPKAVLKVKEGYDEFGNYSYDRTHFFNPSLTDEIPVVRINELLANSLLEPVGKTIKQIRYELEGTCRPSSFVFAHEMCFNGNNAYQKADINNLVAVIEGSDLKDECVVLSAHYDHIGKTYRGEVYPGADDNATGVAAVMEIARVLNQAKAKGNGPRRTVLVLLTTAEEDGLYGSKYYVHNPIIPLEKTIANVNIDMLGRMGNDATEQQKQQGYVYALTATRGMNDTLISITDSINTVTTKMALLKDQGGSYNGFYSRSDHYNFYEKNIPSIFFTNSDHEDLHRTTDVVEKIDFQAMHQRTQLVFLTVWELANNANPFKPLKQEDEELMIEVEEAD